jgi:hypothetical protein
MKKFINLKNYQIKYLNIVLKKYLQLFKKTVQKIKKKVV